MIVSSSSSIVIGSPFLSLPGNVVPKAAGEFSPHLVSQCNLLDQRHVSGERIASAVGKGEVRHLVHAASAARHQVLKGGLAFFHLEPAVETPGTVSLEQRLDLPLAIR